MINDKLKVCVVTGCLGFLGKHLTIKLLMDNWKVYGIDKGCYCADAEALERFMAFPGFKFSDTDIVDIDWLPQCDFIINCAAESHVANSIKDSSPFIHTNVVGVQNLLSLIQNQYQDGEEPTFIHISTDEVYGDIEEGCFDEESALKPSNPYAASKAAADMLINSWARTHGLQYNIIRPANLYGQNQYPEKLIPLSIKNLDRKKKIKLHNNGTPKRTWLNVLDAVKGIIHIMDHGVNGETYNMSSRFEIENIEVVTKILDCYFNNEYNFDDHVDFSFSRPGQDVRYSIDDSKLRNLGWEPKKKFNCELYDIVAFHKENSKW